MFINQSRNILRLIFIIVICLFLWNQLVWAHPPQSDTLRPTATAQSTGQPERINIDLKKIKAASAGSDSQKVEDDPTVAIRKILEDLPRGIDTLGKLFQYLLTAESKILESFETEEKKYDQLVRICCEFDETEFNERAGYIIKQGKQIKDPTIPIEVEPGILEFKIIKEKTLEGPEGIEITVIKVEYKKDTSIPKWITFEIIAPWKYPIIRPDPEFRDRDLRTWKQIVNKAKGRPFIKAYPIRSFFRTNWRNTIWIGGEDGYWFRIKPFFEQPESDLLYNKGFLCVAEIKEPVESFIPPGDLLEKGQLKSSSAGRKYEENEKVTEEIHLQKLRRIAEKWEELFPKAKEAKAREKEKLESDYERGYGLKDIIDYNSFDSPEGMFKSDRSMIDKFLDEQLTGYGRALAGKRKNISLKELRYLLEIELKRQWKQIEVDPEQLRMKAQAAYLDHLSPEFRMNTVRHLKQRRYDLDVFSDKVEIFKTIAEANLDTDEKLNLVLKTMLGHLNDRAESVFSHQNKDDRVFQPVFLTCVYIVLDSIVSFNPERVADALIPLLKKGDYAQRWKIGNILIRCIEETKSILVKRKIASAIREVEKDSIPLPFGDNIRPVKRLEEVMPKIKIYLEHWVTEELKVAGVVEIEEGSTVKEVLLSLGIPIIENQVIDIGRKFESKSVLDERIGGSGKITILSEMDEELESLLKKLFENNLIKPATFNEKRKWGLIFTLLCLKQAGYELVRQMRDQYYVSWSMLQFDEETINMVNIFAEKIYGIIEELGTKRAKVFLTEFTLPIIRTQNIQLLHRLLFILLKYELFESFITVLETGGGDKNIEKILEFCYEYTDRVSLAEAQKQGMNLSEAKLISILGRIASKKEELEPAEFKSWLKEFLVHFNMEKFSFSYSYDIYIVQEAEDRFVYYGYDESFKRFLSGISLFSEGLELKKIDEAKRLLELMKQSKIELRRLNENVLELAEIFSAPIAKRICKGFLSFAKEHYLGAGIEFLQKRTTFEQTLTKELEWHTIKNWGAEKSGDILTIHFTGDSVDAQYDFKVDISGLELPRPNVNQPGKIRLHFLLTNEIPFAQQHKIKIRTDLRPYPLIYDERGTYSVVWKYDWETLSFVRYSPGYSGENPIAEVIDRQA